MKRVLSIAAAICFTLGSVLFLIVTLMPEDSHAQV